MLFGTFLRVLWRYLCNTLSHSFGGHLMLSGKWQTTIDNPQTEFFLELTALYCKTTNYVMPNLQRVANTFWNIGLHSLELLPEGIGQPL